MKKIIVVMLVFLSITLIGCKSKKYISELPNDIQIEIEAAKGEETGWMFDTHLLYFYGGFGDVYAVFLDPARIGEQTQTVAGCTFEYTSRNNMDIYYKGEFYSLQEAYDEKLLSDKNIQKIKENFDKKENLGLRRELTEQGLTASVYAQFVETYPDLSIGMYLGSYNNAHVAWYSSIRPNTTLQEYLEISDCVYYYHEYFGVKVVNNKQSYSLQEAYEKGLLTTENIKDITTKWYGDPNVISVFTPSGIAGKEQLTVQSQYNIAKAYNDKYEVVDPETVIEDIMNKFYLGKHNGYYVTYVYYYSGAETSELVTIELAGYKFEIMQGEEAIAVYKDGEVYSLQEAYDNKLLSNTDIKNIHGYL